MFRFATLSLVIAIVLAVLGFGGLAGDFAGIALILFGLSLLFSGVLFGIGALENRDRKRCYN